MISLSKQEYGSRMEERIKRLVRAIAVADLEELEGPVQEEFCALSEWAVLNIPCRHLECRTVLLGSLIGVSCIISNKIEEYKSIQSKNDLEFMEPSSPGVN